MNSHKMILFISLVIVMLGFGIVMPLFPFYITHFGASGSALGLMMAVYSFMQFLFSPVWGRLSDRVGRKPVLLIGVSGYVISFVLQALSQDIYQFIAARTIAGILSSATLPTAMAIAADTSKPEERSASMGLMGAAMGLGMIFGPVLGGVLTRVDIAFPQAIAGLMQKTIDPASGNAINLSIPFLAAALLAFITLPLIVLLLPESLTQAQKEAAGGRTERGFKPLLSALRGELAFLYVMAFLLSFALANMESILGLYGKDKFNMGPADIGILMGAIGILSVIQQGFTIKPLTIRFGEAKILKSGLVVSMAGFIGLAVWASPAGMLVSACIFTVGNSLLWPSVTGLISRKSGDNQGTALGLASSFQSLGRASGPLWAGFLYDFNGIFPYLSGAAFQLIALLVSLRYATAQFSSGGSPANNAEILNTPEP